MEYSRSLSYTKESYNQCLVTVQYPRNITGVQQMESSQKLLH